jgi:hypothetical protein
VAARTAGNRCLVVYRASWVAFEASEGILEPDLSRCGGIELVAVETGAREM